MRQSTERGNFIEWLLMLLALSVIIFSIIVPRGKGGLGGGFPSFSPVSLDSINYGIETTTSSGNTGIAISTGNAAYTLQPQDEYIVIENRGGTSVNITGWRLENAKSQRGYASGSELVHYASDTAVIPQGARLISTSGSGALGNIILKPGEKAIVLSGTPGNLGSTQLVSFKENACTGYLSESVSFSPSLDNSCVRPSNETGASNLDTACRSYLDSMRSCHTPKYDTRTTAGSTCSGCVDNKSGLSGACVSYIKSHFSYAGCLASHSSDSDFESRTWRVFLYRPWEMWADSHETIYLYDNFNRLITSTSY